MKSFNLFFKRKFFFFLFLTLTSFVGQAQFIIKYPTTAQEITVCLNASLLTVRVDIGALTTSNDTVIINLPPGISYVPGSVIKTEGTDILGIVEAGGTPEAPMFK